MSKEIKIGLISVVSIASFYWLFTFLNGKDIFTSGEIYYVTYNNVDGLLPTRPVNVNGLKVGSVEDIRIVEKKDSLYFIVKMVLNRKLNFSKNTIAEIYEPGLMAGKQIKLNLDYNGAPAKSGDTLMASNSKSLMSMLSNRLQPTQNKVDSVLTTLNGTLGKYGDLADKETGKALKDVLKNLNKTIISLEETSNAVKALALSTNKISEKLDTKINGLADNTNQALITANSTLKTYGELAEKLNDGKMEQTLANLEQGTAELKNFLSKIDNSNGTLNKMIGDQSLYDNLNQTSKNLNILISDFKDRPDKYVQFSIFGKKVKYENDTLN